MRRWSTSTGPGCINKKKPIEENGLFLNGFIAEFYRGLRRPTSARFVLCTKPGPDLLIKVSKLIRHIDDMWYIVYVYVGT